MPKNDTSHPKFAVLCVLNMPKQQGVTPSNLHLQVLHAAECEEGPENRPAVGSAHFPQHVLKAKQQNQHRARSIDSLEES